MFSSLRSQCPCLAGPVGELDSPVLLSVMTTAGFVGGRVTSVSAKATWHSPLPCPRRLVPRHTTRRLDRILQCLADDSHTGDIKRLGLGPRPATSRTYLPICSCTISPEEHAGPLGAEISTPAARVLACQQLAHLEPLICDTNLVESGRFQFAIPRRNRFMYH